MNKTELIIRSILELYSERLETHGYTDSDWRDEKPTAIDKFFRDCKKDIEMILNPMQDNKKEFTLDEIMTIQRTYPYYLTTKELEIILKKYLEERDNKPQLKVPAQTNTEISERLKQLSAKHPTLIKYYSKDITQKEYLTALGHEQLITNPDGKVFSTDAIWIKCYNNDDGNTIAVPEITMNFFYLIDEYIQMLNTFHPLEMADTPLPLYDMIGKLIDATHILLHEKDYDGHGWEEIQASYKKAIEWREMYEAYRKNKH